MFNNLFKNRVLLKIKSDLNHINVNLDKISILLLILFSLSLLFSSVFIIKPIIAGDGHEYLAQTISFFNHLSPDLREQDIGLRKTIESDNNINFFLDDKYIYYGYEKSPQNGNYYPIHFWLYSLLNLPVFSILNILNINALMSFQITNSILLIFSLCIIVFCTHLDSKIKLILFLLSSLNYVLLYIPWPHPEVFTYSFILVSIAFMLDKKYYLSVLFSSVASLQNPPIAVLTVFLIIFGWKEKSWNIKSLLILTSFSAITAIPYLFYLIYFNTFNLITKLGYASVNNISLDKVLGLFIDLNFGLLPYYSILLIVALISLFISIKKNEYPVPALWIVLIIMAIGCSTQGNWNGGMMYINRYLMYFIPLIFAIILISYNYYPKQIINAIIIISIVTTSLYTLNLCLNYDLGAYVKFNELSTMVLTHAPSLYNPPYEIFAERTLGGEFNYYHSLPIIYLDDAHPYKILTDYDHLQEVEKRLNRTIPYVDVERIRKLGMGYINL